jgi:hypothetical protein
MWGVGCIRKTKSRGDLGSKRQHVCLEGRCRLRRSYLCWYQSHNRRTPCLPATAHMREGVCVWGGGGGRGSRGLDKYMGGGLGVEVEQVA